jgi:hypothetical protein
MLTGANLLLTFGLSTVSFCFPSEHLKTAANSAGRMPSASHQIIETHKQA